MNILDAGGDNSQLDDALNCWADGESSPPDKKEDLRDVAVEFHQHLSRAETRDPRANGVDPQLWSRIAAGHRKDTEMHAMRAVPKSVRQLRAESTTRHIPEVQRSRSWWGASLTISMAAGLVLALLIGMVAVRYVPSGGEGGDNENLAAPSNVGATSIATPTGPVECNVEPLTADEVMAIVRNPDPFVHTNSNTDPRDTYDARFLMDSLGNDLELLNGQPMGENKDAVAFVNTYWACREHGSYGQLWALYHPYALQAEILNQFGLFMDQNEVNIWIQARVNSPASVPYAMSPDSKPIPRPTASNGQQPESRIANSDPRSIRGLAGPSWLGNGPILSLGTILLDDEGKTIMTTDGAAVMTGGVGYDGFAPAALIVYFDQTNDRWYFISPFTIG